MSWWPGWNSIEGTHFWHEFFWWLGIICLAGLVASEIVAKRYSGRKDDLVAAAEQTVTEQRQRDADASEARRKADVGALEKQLAEADKKVTDLQKQQAPRRLADQQKQVLIAALSPFRGEKVDVTAVMNDGESMQYALDFVPVFKNAGWDTGGGVSQIATDPPGPVGIEVTLNQAEVAAGRVPKGTEVLVRTLFGLGLISENKAWVNSGTKPALIEFRVGRKPPPN